MRCDLCSRKTSVIYINQSYQKLCPWCQKGWNMRFKFGKTSIKNRETLSLNLRRVADRALSYGVMDFSIVCGHRSKAEQNRLFKLRKSKVLWPDSKHNHLPSLAIDCVPYVAKKSSWNKLHCCVLTGLILAAGREEGVNLRWGGNWDMDSEPITDQDFQDLVHFEEVDS